jgi:dihydrodipicolinate synthase/N-acetylneuraminate lyase
LREPLISEADIILATGHLSPEEALAITKAAREHGVNKILIQHADISRGSVSPPA